MLDTRLWAGMNLAIEGQNSAFSAKAITRDLTRHSLHLTVRPLPFTKTYQAWTSEGFPQLDLESEDGLMRKLFFRCRLKTTDRIATKQIPSTATKINASPMVLGRPRTRGGAIVTCNVQVAVSCRWS